MPFNYKKVLVVGATSGIGKALATKMVSDGIFVIAVGRRKERLDAFVEKHGKDKADAVEFDITKLADIPQFAANIIQAHPDLDSVFLNSGIQRVFDLSKPETIDLAVVETEFTTNYLSYIHLLKVFLPHLQKQPNETSVIITTSGLAIIPIMICPNYCASKAALHHIILMLREQMKRGPGNVKVIEICPPLVQTELHDEKNQPGVQHRGPPGMPIDEFLLEAWNGLSAGEESIPIGFVKNTFANVEGPRQKVFDMIHKNL
jgi:short-subunit dehydrogenase involved in D-alanine esterification of teichoic acids